MRGSSAKTVELTEREKNLLVEVLYFPWGPGHLAVKINSIKDKFTGFYLSHGSRVHADDDYENGESKDTESYGEPICIELDLPEHMTLSQLTHIKYGFLPGEYSMSSNNCADQALRLLKSSTDGLGYTLLQDVETKLTTTPMYVATQACFVALDQNEQFKQSILKKTNAFADPLVAIQLLLQCEKNRLLIECSLVKISSVVSDWNAINIPKKLFQNVTEVSTVDTKISKIHFLNALEQQIVITQSSKTPESYKILLDELKKGHEKIGGRTALALETCIQHFPTNKLPKILSAELEAKYIFLIEFKLLIKTNNEILKKQTTLGLVLPDGIIKINEHLAKLDLLNKFDVPIQQIFFDVHKILQDKSSESGKTEILRNFYEDWNIKFIDVDLQFKAEVDGAEEKPATKQADVEKTNNSSPSHSRKKS